MGNWIKLNFWFGYFNPPLLVIWQYIFGAFLVLLLVLAIVSLVMCRRHKAKKFWSRLESFSFGNLAIGAVLFFFHYEQTPLFTARIILLLWVVLMIFWAVKVFKKVKISPEARKRWEAEKLYNKYLPK